jgi:DNA-binding MarR family transcriptional regulator
MEYRLDELINIILSKSEQLEEDLKNRSALKDLTVNQLHCIEVVGQRQNPTLTEIAAELKITKASASVLVDKLAEKGYVKKVQSDTDRRSAHLHLTEKGELAGNLHKEVHLSFAKLLTTPLVETEKEQLVGLLNKAVAGLK